MAIFFFVVALEIKRELVFGDLSDTRKAALPVAAAEFVHQAPTRAVTLGVMLGLVVGKVVGVTGFAWLAVRVGWAALPGGVAWRHITGAGLIGGVGFTVSQFITGLAFSETLLIEEAKVGVLAASVMAALGGYLFLLRVSRGSKPGEEKGSGAGSSPARLPLNRDG